MRPFTSDRTVRVLPSGAQTARGAAQRTVAPASANKFVRRSLLLNKSDRKREWERKSGKRHTLLKKLSFDATLVL